MSNIEIHSVNRKTEIISFYEQTNKKKYIMIISE